MKIVLNIEAETLDQFHTVLKEIIGGSVEVTYSAPQDAPLSPITVPVPNTPVVMESADLAEEAKHTRTRKRKTKDTPEEVKSAEEVTTETAELSTTESQPEAPKYTLLDVRGKLQKLGLAGHQAEIKKLINDLGYTKLSEVPETKYSELMTAAEEIG
ncbi:MAG: hypothetical protein H6Q67_1498 [Firmicutes bacterium]|nr:hypothetical protein [Bacillota bacterium]